MKTINDPLLDYKKKRDFALTPEPAEDVLTKASPLSFVVQKHAARNLHYDFRLELDGVLKSWAIPKGPSLDPMQKRLAVHVEDHPLSYAEFEGEIPPKQYGAGTVIIWDRGTWEPIGDPRKGLDSGLLKFQLYGEKLRGAWTLVRMRGKPDERQDAWLLIKERDEQSWFKTERDEIAIPIGAKPGLIPPLLTPQLATLVDRIPMDNDWLYEIKFDGYRILARIDKGDVALFTRNGHDWTAKLKKLVVSMKKLNLASGWLDGEIVMFGENGMPDFGALQNAFEKKQTDDVHYFLFDIPFYAGFDLREVSLANRRALLSDILLKSTSLEQIRFSEDFAARGKDILKSACRLGLEGVIGKRKDSAYISGKSANWIKLKCVQRQEFVVVGYTEARGKSEGIGALLLGFYDEEGHLRYAGRVGTGFDGKVSSLLKKKLSLLAVDQTMLFEKPKEAIGNWIIPELVAEVSFAEWTKEGRVRNAVFQGLRDDKPASAIIREEPRKALYTETNDPVTEFASPQISNPNRIIDSSTGLRKLDLVNYYKLAAKRMLPHLVNRPVSFLRAPTGIEGELFFQKHGDTLRIPGLNQFKLELSPGDPALMEIETMEALIGAAQMNVVEFHTWNVTTQNIEKPDRMIFDLDPGEGLPWSMMLEAAELTRTLLEELELQSFLKTSGGNGLHIVVPLTLRDDWETVKEFSKAVSKHLAAVMPNRFAALSGIRNRVGKIFVDYIRNNRGATTVAAFSARARPGMGVSMPCSWTELLTLTGGAHWTIETAKKRLESSEDPWIGYGKTKQILRKGSKKNLLHR
ncbi:MAG: ligD [Firmicutes bacterium]|nr:ligD [Bacillota bacterium]